MWQLHPNIIITNDWLNRKLINDFLKCTEPDAVAARKSGRFKRKRFWSAGVMEYLSIDQHDKWGRFGLWLHLATDPFNSRVAWLKIWWCNCNPRLLINYYLEAGRKVGGMCLTIYPSFPCFQFCRDPTYHYE